MSWSNSIGNGNAARRAGARRRWNAEQQRQKFRRRFEILRMFVHNGIPGHGFQTKLAKQFGVSNGTMSHDVRWAKLMMKDAPDGFTLESNFKDQDKGIVSWVNKDKKVDDAMAVLREIKRKDTHAAKIRRYRARRKEREKAQQLGAPSWLAR